MAKSNCSLDLHLFCPVILLFYLLLQEIKEHLLGTQYDAVTSINLVHHLILTFSSLSTTVFSLYYTGDAYANRV